MDQGAVVERVREYAELVRRHIPVSKVVLYGSYASGRAHEDSDIDVAVIVPHVEGDFLDLAAQLFRWTRDIDLRIEPVLLQEGHDRSGFIEEVLRTGEVVYSRGS